MSNSANSECIYSWSVVDNNEKIMIIALEMRWSSSVAVVSVNWMTQVWSSRGKWLWVHPASYTVGALSLVAFVFYCILVLEEDENLRRVRLWCNSNRNEFSFPRKLEYLGIVCSPHF
jgi:hypothetical protein